jgi:hypothetical protein
MKNQILRGIILLPSTLICIFWTSQTNAEPAPVLTPANKPVTVLEQKQVGKFPAGTEASFLIVANPNTSDPALVQENQAVVLPIAGKLGGSDIPKDSVLVGTFKRVNEKSGFFEFSKLVLGTQVYAAKIMSEPVNGRLMQDPKVMQAMMSDMQGIFSGLPSQAEVQKKTDEGYAQAAASMVPNILSGFIPGGGLLSGVASAAQGASAANDAKAEAAKAAVMNAKMEAAMKKLQAKTDQTPPALFAEIAPLQNLKIKFVEAVDLSTPVATLSTPMKAQGILTQPKPDTQP